MSDKPILFSAPMVRALLAGTKTQTRRAIKRQPYGRYIPLISFNHGRMEIAFGPDMKAKGGGPLWWRPVAQPGDLLWVREHWRTDRWFDDIPPSELPRNAPIHYEADPVDAENLPLADGRFRASMFMPRVASRITLTVTDVRVERLQNISEADAWAEGCKKGDPDDVGGFFPAEEMDPSGIGFRGWDNACDWYADLWDEINGDGAWDANPWVAAYTFTVGLHNIDRAIA
jgi:hypothetical protein